MFDAETVKEGTAELVRRTDLIVASSRFPRLSTGVDDPERALRALLDEGPSFAAMTLGRDGAIAVTKDGTTIESRGYAIEAVDTTGAGDFFHGAFVYGFLQGWPILRTLDFANAAAALNCMAVGARGGTTSLERILDLMESGRRV